MPRNKLQKWFDSLSEENKSIVLAVGLVVFVLFVVAILSNPIVSLSLLALSVLVGFTVYAKYKTGKWWFRTYPSQENKLPPKEMGSVDATGLPHPMHIQSTSGRPLETPAPSSTPTPTLSTASNIGQAFTQSFSQLDIDQQVEYLTKAIQSFHPPRNPPNEVAYHDMLVSNLQTHYPAIKLHRQIGSEIDALVGRIGIEAKLWLGKQEADRLFSQIDTFLHDGYIDRLIVVLYQPIAQWPTYLNEKLARLGWLDKQVRVITV